jgi:hypothetical protein
VPGLQLIGPSGAVVNGASGGSVAQLDLNAPLTGTYTVTVASVDYRQLGTGDYRLVLMKVPGPVTTPAGDQGGPLTNGGNHTGTITLGDRDVWTFTATQGDRLSLTMTWLTETLTPAFQVIGPTGAVVTRAARAYVAQVDLNAPVTGAYTVIVGSGDYGNRSTGDYRVTVSPR